MSNELQAGMDYVWCDECKVHVACIPLQPGVWEVQCPKCVGECSICHCHLATHCFGQGGVAMEIRIRAVKVTSRP